MRRVIAAAAVLLALSALAGPAWSDALPGYEPMQTGPGIPGQWKMVEDADATGGRVIEQSSDDPTDDRFPLLIRMATAPADVTVRVRIKPVSGAVDQAGGLAVRLIDRNNYYLVRANALEGNVRFYKVVAGRRVQLAGVDVPVASGVWHDLAVTVRDDRFTVSFDGRDLFSATDATIVTPGKVAFWTKADSVTRFDRLDVEELR
ncbi:hypothetical protein [Methylobacterium radiotolerans]|jgi:hypothetical protein|uniref:hypothetical protein n=1 Tax=Methylobacterium radiotolerans TaxID=31998 RepID=UPI0038D24349